MSYTIKPTTRFQKDLRLMQRRGYDMSLIADVIKLLAEGETLPDRYHDHQLTGSYKECRECHITPDWLLIYEIDEDTLYLYLTRTGSHSDLFKK